VLRRVEENTAKRREVLMTDIIERLRNLHDHYPTSGQLGAENIKIFQEAADEIEVLRIGIDQIKYFVGTFPREPASAYLPKRDQSIKLVK
jgi:hypothetical protein